MNQLKIKDSGTLKGNQLKDDQQDYIVEQLFHYFVLFLNAATGFGKTNTGIKAILYYEKYFVNQLGALPHLIIVPTLDLKKQWEGKQIPNTEVIVINSVVIKGLKSLYGVVIVDEVHRILNEEAEKFSTVLDHINSHYLLVLSATTKQEHEEFLEKKRPGVVKYVLSLYWCYRKGLIPDNKNINIPVQFTLDERLKYIKLHDEYNKYVRLFASYNIFNPFEKEEVWTTVYEDVNGTKRLVSGIEISFEGKNLTNSQVKGMFVKWQKATSRRSHLLYNAKNKVKLANDLVNMILDNESQKILVFAKSIDVIEELAASNQNIIAYHSKITSEKVKKSIFKQFYEDTKRVMATINTIIEGFDLVNYAESMGLPTNSASCQMLIRLAYDSNPGKTTQTFGRALRFDERYPNRMCIMFNIYVDDFTARNQLYKSQEKIWLERNLASQVVVENVYSLEEIEL